MNTIDSGSHLELLLNWLHKLPDWLRKSEYNPELIYYGTGESAHWPVQSHCSVFATLGVIATAPELDDSKLPMKRAEMIDTALRMMRYALTTHLGGSEVCSDGKQWGHHWISVLGLERMAHAVNALQDYLTDSDRELLRKVMISESDWVLESYPVSAGLLGRSGCNKPESNIWNGGILLRTALEYPDAPNHDRYLEKSTSFFLNGLSHPLDAACETKFRGKPVREWYIGSNFGPDWSLDHHGHLNVGYTAVALSNVAMIHFFCKERGYEPPPELYWHVREVWEVLKHFTFHDGCMIRFGGDVRTRYSNCQNYAIPAWLLMEDLIGDPEAAQFEQRFLEIMKHEQDYSSDGGFYSKRLDNIRKLSYYYYVRLESDAALNLSFASYWRRKFKLVQPSAVPVINTPCTWKSEFHGSTFMRSGASIRSWTWHAAMGPTGLCIPAINSDLGEWQGNLHGSVLSTLTPRATQGDGTIAEFEGGFLNYGECHWQELDPQGEGEHVYDYARHRVACVALPDDKSLLVMEHATIIKEVTLDEVRSIGVLVPNDIFNANQRRYRAEGLDEVLPGNPGCEDSRVLASNHILVDDAMAVTVLYGGKGLTLYRTEKPRIVIRKSHGPWMHSLYVDEICGEVNIENRRVLPGTVVLDDGFVVTASAQLKPAKFRSEISGGLRKVEYESDGVVYLMIANFGEQVEVVSTPPGAELLAGCVELQPGAALLFRL